jgi:hypothetical protein
MKSIGRTGLSLATFAIGAALALAPTFTFAAAGKTDSATHGNSSAAPHQESHCGKAGYTACPKHHRLHKAKPTVAPIAATAPKQ